MPIAEGDVLNAESAHQRKGEIDMKSTKTLFAVAAGLALSLTGIGSATAATSTDSSGIRIVVRYADAELATPEGLRSVQRRILAAVTRVCPGGDIRNLELWAPTVACRAQALAQAAAQVRNPQLAAVLTAKANQS